MLAVIGAGSIDELFDEIPTSLTIAGLPAMGAGLSEAQITRLMLDRAAADGRPLCFIGAGAYEHHIPAARATPTGAHESHSYCPPLWG